MTTPALEAQPEAAPYNYDPNRDREPLFRCLGAILIVGREGISEARSWTTRVLRGTAPTGMVDMAVLLASELTTNAVLAEERAKRPKPGALLVLGSIDVGRYCLEVYDESNELPKPRNAGEEDTNGRGLGEIVEFLTVGWGVKELPNGKAVWVEISEESAAAA